MRRGDTLLLHVEALAFGGDAVARAPDGRVVFLAGGGAPGDRVTATIEEVKPRFVRAALEAVVEAGPHRVAPRCPLSGRCGGCQWQEVSLEAQRAAKQQVVERALGRLGAAVEPLVAATLPFGERSRARMTRGPEGLGFQARRSHAVIDVQACPQLEPALDRALATARRHLLPLLPPGATVSGLVGRGGRVHLAVEGTGKGAARGALATALSSLAAEPGIAGVLSEGGALGEETIAIADATDEEQPPFRASAAGFAQASHAGNRVLRALVRREAALLLDGVGAPRVLELFAGDGNFTRDLAALLGATGGGELLAVEGEPGACARLPGNVPGPVRPRLLALSAEEAVRRLCGGGERFDLVVLDPPRAGAPEVSALLPRLTDRVLYVSCDPMTLARDAATLAAGGLAPERATPVDLMPHTTHVETVLTLRRRG